MSRVVRRNSNDIRDKQYIFGVQISNVGGDSKILLSQYDFPTKTDAVKWAVKNTGPKQYATIVKVLNKNYWYASEYTKYYTYHVLAYEKGIQYGFVRQSPIGPILIDESEKYFYRINENGRLVGKTPISQIPLRRKNGYYY